MQRSREARALADFRKMHLRVIFLTMSFTGWALPAGADSQLPENRAASQKFWVGQLTVNCQRPVGQTTWNDTACPKLGSAFNCTGKLGSKSPAIPESGVLVHVRSGSANTGCDSFQNAPKFTKWIALVMRGGCKFDSKMQNAVRHNATAVVVYDSEQKDEVPIMSHEAYDMVSIIVPMDCGKMLASQLDDLADRGLYLESRIVPIEERDLPLNELAQHDDQVFNRTSVLIVTITFIVLMIFSLGWLVFYYVQRFRFASMKDKLARQLADAAKQAIKKIPKRTVRPSDMNESNVCAVCIESYKSDDVVRELPCSHVFHKHCVDQWLIDKRVCPMCKLNILEAYGIRVKRERGSTEEEEERLTEPVPPLLPARTRASDSAEASPTAADASATYRAEIAIVPASLHVSYGSGRGRDDDGDQAAAYTTSCPVVSAAC